MLKLRTLLLHDYIYYVLLLITILISIPRLYIKSPSIYTTSSNELTAKVIDISKKDNKYQLTVKAEEKLIVYYYLKENENLNINLGDIIQVTGTFTIPVQNTSENLFNYKEYLSYKKIKFLVKAKELKIVKRSSNPMYKIKSFVKKQASINSYIESFLFGDMSNVSSTVKTSYQDNGISHLFAISGMQITLIAESISKILKKLKIQEEKRFLISSIVVTLYYLLINKSPSALRGLLSFEIFSINQIYYFYIKPSNLFIIVLSITLLINPFYIYDLGFQYSFLISFSLIAISTAITGNYLQKLLKTSLISFLVSIPISLKNSFQINILSIFYNIFYVPFINLIVFPLSIIVLIIKPLLPIYKVIILLLEKSSLFLNKITLVKFIFPKLPSIVYLLYFLLLIIIYLTYHKTKKYIVIFLSMLLIHYHTPYLHNETYMNIIDVGQGDSILLHSSFESALIDTGGSMFSNTSSIAKNTLIPYLKSKGIRKLKYLVLTHGDADHMKDALYLVKHFKVEEIIINMGKINYLEEELINNFSNIKVGLEGTILNIGDISLIQLNEDLNDENDSSQIYYGVYNKITFLLTGDASLKSENNLLSKYELGEIDILKVGHHGSKTSTGKQLVATINPKTCLISVGKDNKFNHPNKEVLKRLNRCDTYRTDIYGTIQITLKQGDYEIKTFK